MFSFLDSITNRDFEESPKSLFESLLLYLAIFSISVKSIGKLNKNYYSKKTLKDDNSSSLKEPTTTVPLYVKKLQWKFLPAFWLLRMAFWMSGPYFYSAMASKTYSDGTPFPVSLISRMALTGYISTPLFGNWAGKFLHRYGPKYGTIAACVLYSIGALSFTSNSIPVLILGRALGGIGSSMMSSSPEAWLVSAVKLHDKDSSGIWLASLFGKAFAFDPIIAILAGKVAFYFAERLGPTGPFQVLPIILFAAVLVTSLAWDRTVFVDNNNNNNNDNNNNAKDNILRDIILKDRSIILVGCVQCFFESAMHVFVMLWPSTMTTAVLGAFGESSVTPFGTIFSCFMASCWAGGIVWKGINKRIGYELSLITVLVCSILSMALTAVTITVSHPSSSSSRGMQHLWELTAAYFLFEATVGAYFPVIGILRAKHLPDSSRAMIMTTFQQPTNAIITISYAFFHTLGIKRAAYLTAFLLGLATLCMILLYWETNKKMERLTSQRMKIARRESIGKSETVTQEKLDELETSIRKDLRDELESSIKTSVANIRGKRCSFEVMPIGIETITDTYD